MTDYHQKDRIGQLIARAERDRKNGNWRKALDRYEGSFRTSPSIQKMHNLAAELYLEIDDVVRAGRHWYFKAELNAVELDCVHAFERSFGNSPTHILMNLLYKDVNRIRLASLSVRARNRLESLVVGAAEERGELPRFLWCFRKFFPEHFS